MKRNTKIKVSVAALALSTLPIAAVVGQGSAHAVSCNGNTLSPVDQSRLANVEADYAQAMWRITSLENTIRSNEFEISRVSGEISRRSFSNGNEDYWARSFRERELRDLTATKQRLESQNGSARSEKSSIESQQWSRHLEADQLRNACRFNV
jgi:hypothetical protein